MPRMAEMNFQIFSRKISFPGKKKGCSGYAFYWKYMDIQKSCIPFYEIYGKKTGLCLSFD